MTDEEDPGQVVVDDPEERIAELEDQVDDLEDRLARTLADRSNLRKRLDREVERARTRGRRDILLEVAPVLEDLDRVLTDGDVDPDGVRLVRDNLEDALDGFDVSRIETEGATFDPSRHEAVARVETEEVPDGHVAEEVRPGYVHGDDVLRPAKVTVATTPDDTDDPDEEE